jgi:hypothetical protein
MEEDDSDIAAAMGFGSFGTKKRKYDQSSSPKPKADSSGANSTQLGVRMKKAAKDELDVDHGTVGVEPGISSPSASKPKPKSAQNSTAATGLAEFLARAQTLPDKPPVAPQDDAMPDRVDPFASQMISFGGPSISRAELQALKFGVKDENGDTAYFLPNFVGDPWEGMKSGQ